MYFSVISNDVGRRVDDSGYLVSDGDLQ